MQRPALVKIMFNIDIVSYITLYLTRGTVVLLGSTGPIETFTRLMAYSADLAMKEITDSCLLLGGATVTSVRGDCTSTEAGAGTAAAERLIISDRVAAIVGPECSRVTTVLLNNVAVTYTNNDYGNGFADAFNAAYENAVRTTTLVLPHDDGKADQSAEVSALPVAGADAWVVLGYADQGGFGNNQGALDSDTYDKFAVGDGMHSEDLMKNMGSDLSIFGTVLWTMCEGPKQSIHTPLPKVRIPAVLSDVKPMMLLPFLTPILVAVRCASRQVASIITVFTSPCLATRPIICCASPNQKGQTYHGSSFQRSNSLIAENK